MSVNRLLFLFLSAWLLSLPAVAASAAQDAEASPGSPPQFTDSQLQFFESQVRPLLVEHCWECHAGAKLKGSLSLESRAALLAGGDSGPAIVPGDPASSLLIRAIHYD
ncbi:MAG: c-type cytochrome domain-containing protein, partial [Planctomyces sp.]